MNANTVFPVRRIFFHRKPGSLWVFSFPVPTGKTRFPLPRKTKKEFCGIVSTPAVKKR